MSDYAHPNFLVIRERQLSGTFSAAGAASAYVGSSLKVATKAVVVGVTLRIGSGGSLATNCTIGVARIGTSATISNMQYKTLVSSVGASMAGDVYEIEMTTPFTVASAGEAAALTNQAASVDKMAVLSDVIWQYRLLPADIAQGANKA